MQAQSLEENNDNKKIRLLYCTKSPTLRAVKLEKQQSIVFTISVVVNEAASPRHYFHDGIVLAEKQTRRRDAVAAKILHGTPAGFF